MNAMILALLLSYLPTTIGPTWTWPEERARVMDCDADDWSYEEAQAERGERCMRREAEAVDFSFAWGG